MPDSLALKGKTALVTGASRGIGAAVAKRFASEGAHVILLARTVGALEEVDDAIQAEGVGSASIVPMDLKDFSQIDTLAVSLAERFKKLDILVGNAAVLGGLRPLTHYTDKIWDEVFDVNVHANWRLLRALEPLLKAAEAPRVMFVTSGVTQAAFPYWGAYAASKAALEMMVYTYANETAQTSIRANVIDPGVAATAMRAEAMPGEDPDELPDPESKTEIFVQLARETCKYHGEKLGA